MFLILPSTLFGNIVRVDNLDNAILELQLFKNKLLFKLLP